MKDEMSLTPAALYARVSSDRQDVDLSVAAQLRALRDFAQRNGYAIVREYVDEAESGRVADRPQFRKMLVNEIYTGTLVWGLSDQNGASPVRVQDAFPAIISAAEFERVSQSLQSRAPERIHPRQAASRYLLSGLVRCGLCRRALTAAEAKGGRYSYYVC